MPIKDGLIFFTHKAKLWGIPIWYDIDTKFLAGTNKFYDKLLNILFWFYNFFVSIYLLEDNVEVSVILMEELTEDGMEKGENFGA